MFVCFEAATIAAVCAYEKRVCANPASSLMYDSDHTHADAAGEADTGAEGAEGAKGAADTANMGTGRASGMLPFGAREKAILAVFALTLAVLAAGVVRYSWYMTEISALFLAMPFVAVAIGRLGVNGYVETLARSMAGITSGVLIAGFAKGIPIVLQEGKIMDTLRHAAVSMQIMAILADMVGITRQTAGFLAGGRHIQCVLPRIGLLRGGSCTGRHPVAKVLSH